MMPENTLPPTFKVKLSGRFWALLSVFPVFLFGFILLMASAFMMSWLVLKDGIEAFELMMAPFLSGIVFLIILFALGLWLMRWYGKKTLEILPEGMLLTTGEKEPVFVRWTDLAAVELRFNPPNLVQCSLKTPFWEFGFSNLDLNLVGRVPFHLVYKEGFRIDRMRQFLLLLKKVSPQLQWRLAKSFQDRYHIYYPPYDLERMV